MYDNNMIMSLKQKKRKLVYMTDHLLPTNLPPKSLTLKFHLLNSFTRAGAKIWNEMPITHCKIFQQMHLKGESKNF